MKNKKYFRKKASAYFIIITTIFLISQCCIHGFATSNTSKSAVYGKLKSVEATGNGPDNNGRCEYTVKITDKAGEEHTYTLWMKYDEYLELKNVIGQWITFYYHMNNSKHIYDGFKYGNHTSNISNNQINTKPNNNQNQFLPSNPNIKPPI